VIDAVNASGADILLVAFGAPRQDLWLHQHRARLTPPVLHGRRRAVRFLLRAHPRAPVWMREMGLEWAYRLLQEPGRMWRRYVIGNPLFLYRVWRQTRSPERFALPAEPGGRGQPPAAGPSIRVSECDESGKSRATARVADQALRQPGTLNRATTAAVLRQAR
jgi:hypothetical protein